MIKPQSLLAWWQYHNSPSLTSVCMCKRVQGMLVHKPPRAFHPKVHWLWFHGLLLVLGLFLSLWLFSHVYESARFLPVHGLGGAHVASVAYVAHVVLPPVAEPSPVPEPKPTPPVAGDPSAAPVGTSWVEGILNGLFSSFSQGFSDFLNGVLSWATTFGFMFLTPDGLTYHQPVVSQLNAWMVGIMDSFLALVLIVGGYNAILGHGEILRELAPRVLFSAIAGTFSLFFLAQLIEVENALSLGFLGALATAGVGDLSLPLGILNWATAPFYEILTYLIDLVMSVLLCLQMLVRIGLLDFLIVLAPLGFLCFALPQTVAWGRLWVQAFVSMLLLQFLQTVCIGLGSVLISSFGHATYSFVSILVGIATLYIAFKLPGMLLSHVLQASVGAVHRDAGRAARSAAEYAALLAA